jgi:DNA-binding XRE family transcriptional regulator
MARQKYGMTQAELARRCGLSKTSINSLERGRVSDPRLSVAVAIADALYLPLDTLLQREVPRRD